MQSDGQCHLNIRAELISTNPSQHKLFNKCRICDLKLPHFMPYESILCSIFAYRYRTSGHSASQSRIGTFFLLLDLMQFFDLYHAGQHDTALDVSFVFEQILAGFLYISCS